jgi:hypothetical protein
MLALWKMSTKTEQTRLWSRADSAQKLWRRGNHEEENSALPFLFHQTYISYNQEEKGLATPSPQILTTTTVYRGLREEC